MAISKGVRNSIGTARELEQNDQLTEAAAIYQKIVDADPINQEVVGRLLVIYRKLKAYQKELAVINGALAAYQQRDKTLQDKWIREHPKAAGAGRSVLRQLEKGGNKASAFGVDPTVNTLVKRKAFVNKRIAAATGSAGKKKKNSKVIGKPKVVRQQKSPKVKEAITARKKAALKRKEVAAARKKKALERRALAEARKKEARERKKAEAARRAAELLAKKQAALVIKMHPSLFVISLRYLVPLEKIDAMMAEHVKYLNRHYGKGDFLVSGRLVPRTGGIIIARGKDRNAVERIVKTDPFLKKKLADVDIVEFLASQVGKGLGRWIKGSGK